MLARRSFLAGSMLSLSAAPLWAEERRESWTQWRGPSRDGQMGKTEWPDKLAASNIHAQWRVELGPSYSGPIVDSRYVYVTEAKEAKREFVRAFDRTTGKPVWERDWVGALKVPFFAAANGDWIRSTPLLDGESLYVGGMRDVLVSLNSNSGEERWRIDFVKEFKSPVPAFGLVCSPLVLGESLYIQAGAGLVKVEKLTGKIVWRTLEDGGGMWGSAFSSPMLATLNGIEQLIVQTREQLAGVALADGKVLWTQKVAAFRGMNILTPTIWKDHIFTSSYGGKSSLFRILHDGDRWSVEEAWTNKTQGYMSSPVIYKDHLYLHLKNQRFTCIDLKTGNDKWTTRPYGQYWSMIVSDDRLLALDQRGELLLIRLSPDKFDLLDTLKISESETWAHLAACDNQLFVRELNAMAVYRWMT